MKHVLFLLMLVAATAKGVDHPIDYAKDAVQAVESVSKETETKTEKMADSAISEIEGSGDEPNNEITVPENCGDLYTITCYGEQGWFVLNKDFTDGEWKKVTSGTKQETVHNEWISKGKKYEDGVATIDGRWLIACTSKFGTVGDKITFYLEDGTALPCIMADEKGVGVDSEWGHEGGRCLLELEVDKDYFFKYGNPGTDKWHPELKQKVVKAVNETEPITTISDNSAKKIDLSEIKFSASCYGKQGWYILGGKLSGGEWKSVTSGTMQEAVHNEWINKGAKFSDGIATIDDRYLIACDPTYGSVGDKVSIKLKDGTSIPCVIADTKGANSIGFEVDKDKYLEHGGAHPISRFWKHEWEQEITSIDDEGVLTLDNVETKDDSTDTQSTVESVSGNNSTVSNVESTQHKLPYINQGLGLFNSETGEWEHKDWPDIIVHGEKALRSVGCGYCATAMACSYITGNMVSPFDIDADRTSESLCAWANNNGVKAHNTASWDEAYTALQNGFPVMVLVRNKVGTRKDDPSHGYWTNEGHFILMFGITEDGKIKVNDSGCANNTYCISGDGHDPAMIYQNASGHDPNSDTKDSEDADYTIFGE